VNRARINASVSSASRPAQHGPDDPGRSIGLTAIRRSGLGRGDFRTRIRNALFADGLKTVGEVREISDEALLSLPDFGKGSAAHLRETLQPAVDGRS
jgi:hypothetical protein